MVAVSVDAVAEAEVGELVIVEYGIVADEVDHRVLADIVDDRHAGQVDGDEESGQTAENDGSVEHCGAEIATELVTAHDIGGIVEDDVAGNEEEDEDNGKNDSLLLSETLHDATPHPAKFEEEDAHRHVVQVEPDWILVFKAPVTEEGEEQVDAR